MKKHILLTLFCLSTFLIQSYSQSDYRKGYIITLQHDTLRGLVDFQSANINAEQCTYKQTLEGASQTYLPGEIIGYRYDKDGKFFISKKLKLADNPEKQIFAEFLIQGKVSIYYYHEGLNAHYLFEKDGLPITDAPFGEKIVLSNQFSVLKNAYTDVDRKYVYNVTTYKGLLHVFMNETPELWKSIDRMDDPSHKNMIKLAKKYHQLACNNQECIVYEEVLPRFSVAIEPIAGVLKLRGMDAAFQYGVLGYIWMPQDNERLYVKVGYLYSEGNSSSDKSYKARVIRIPFQFEYLFPKAIVRPKFSAGLNTYLYKDNVVKNHNKTDVMFIYTVGTGIEVPITKNISFDASVNGDFQIGPIFNEYFLGIYGYGVDGICGIKFRF